MVHLKPELGRTGKLTMAANPDQDWRLAIGCHSNGKLMNDVSSRVTINQAAEAIHLHLATPGAHLLKDQEVTDLVGCLRTVLRFWSKGSQSPSNQWSQTCVDVAGVLALALSQPGISLEALFKSSNLLGFALARAKLMGEVRECIQ